MPKKPDAQTLGAYDAMRNNPDFGKDVLRTIIAETPELRNAMVENGLVEEKMKGE